MYPTDPQGRIEMQTKELNNGRVAMIAIAGMVAQELATGASSRPPRVVARPHHCRAARAPVADAARRGRSAARARRHCHRP